MAGCARGAVAAALLLAACTSSVRGSGFVSPSCPAVFFGVPGSGQGVHNPPPALLPTGVDAGTAANFGTTVGLLEHEVRELAGGRIASSAVDYPAIPVRQYIGAGGLTGDLEVSERLGVRALVSAVDRATAGDCVRRPVLLAGYSQGAEVVVRAVDALAPNERADVVVALFGDPSYEPGETGDYPGHTAAAGIRPTFRKGAFVLPEDVRRRTIDICAPGDPVCGVDPTLHSFVGRVAWVLEHVKIHENAYAFGAEGYTAIAARFLWAHRRG